MASAASIKELARGTQAQQQGPPDAQRDKGGNDTDAENTEKAVEQWKIKKLIKTLEAARGYVMRCLQYASDVSLLFKRIWYTASDMADA